MHPAPVPKGCLISVSRRGAGSGGRGMPCSGDALRKGPAVQAAKHPGARSTSAEGPDGHTGTPVRGAPDVCLVLNGSVGLPTNRTAAGDLAEQTD